MTRFQRLREWTYQRLRGEISQDELKKRIEAAFGRQMQLNLRTTQTKRREKL